MFKCELKKKSTQEINNYIVAEISNIQIFCYDIHEQNMP